MPWRAALGTVQGLCLPSCARPPCRHPFPPVIFSESSQGPGSPVLPQSDAPPQHLDLARLRGCGGGLPAAPAPGHICSAVSLPVAAMGVDFTCSNVKPITRSGLQRCIFSNLTEWFHCRHLILHASITQKGNPSTSSVRASARPSCRHPVSKAMECKLPFCRLLLSLALRKHSAPGPSTSSAHPVSCR